MCLNTHGHGREYVINAKRSGHVLYTAVATAAASVTRDQVSCSPPAVQTRSRPTNALVYFIAASRRARSVPPPTLTVRALK